MQAMEAESGISIRELRADGGAVVNGFLMQHQADVLQVEIQIPEVSETTALGAAYLAGLAVGVWKSKDEIVANWRAREDYQPVMASQDAEALYAKWTRAVDRSRGWIDPE